MGRFSRASDLLAQQRKTMRQLQADGSWTAARLVMVMPGSRVSVLSDREKEDIDQGENVEIGFKKLQPQLGGNPRGGSADC